MWATGYQLAYPWLRVPVLDRHGEIAHHRGVTSVPGLYVLGLSSAPPQFHLRRRRWKRRPVRGRPPDAADDRPHSGGRRPGLARPERLT